MDSSPQHNTTPGDGLYYKILDSSILQEIFLSV